MIPKFEADQSVEPTDGTETKRIKSSNLNFLPSVFVAVLPLTPSDISRSSGITWGGRNGWLREYAQIADRRAREGAQHAGWTSRMDDSDFIFDSIPPAGERRKSCTVALAMNDV